MKQSKLILMLALGACMAGCGQSGFKKTPSGLEYKIFESHDGAKPKEGDYLKMEIIEKVGDSLMHDTHGSTPARIPFQLSHQKFDFMEGLALLSAGDSALFMVPGDSLPAFQRPPFLKKGDNIYIYVKLLAIQNFAQVQEEVQKEHAAQLAKDDKAIADYLSANHIQATKTPSGVYMVIHQQGSGDAPKEGQMVSINYTGKTLNGKAFDSNTDSSAQVMHHPLKPLQFMAGRHQMIQGMDDGIMQLNKGAKATLYIPSSLGYGPNGNPPVIKENEDLIFDVEVLDISGKPAPATPAAPESGNPAGAPNK